MIEHIGASSIPGSVSKGDLDVFFGVPQDKFESVLQALKEVGFLEKEGTFRDDEYRRRKAVFINEFLDYKSSKN